MKTLKKFWLLLDLAIVAPCIYAQEKPTINQTYETIDEKFAYKHFVVNCENEGDYYADFWILPARYPDGKYTTFKVFVNGEFIDNITPSEPNWQSAILDNTEKIPLLEGQNVVSVATTFPELPSVESISLSTDYSNIATNPELYTNYLDAAIIGEDIESELFTAEVEDSEDSEFTLQYCIKNKTLRYNFFKSILCRKGEELCISTTSAEPHYVDIIFEGNLLSIPSISDTLKVPIDTLPINPGIPVNFNQSSVLTGPSTIETRLLSDSLTIPSINLKPSIISKGSASSEEMQGLNWKGASEAIDDVYCVCKYVAIPKDGYYLIRLRPYIQNRLSVADININDTYLYEDMPICYIRANATIPADGYTYCTEIIGANSANDDPMVFIHGAAAARVVGYNDDLPSTTSTSGSLNPHIEQNYIYPVTDISFSSYSSQNPASKCDIYVYKSTEQETVEATILKYQQKKSTEQASIQHIVEPEGTPIIPGLVCIGDEIVIRSKDTLRNISTYNISGSLVGTININDNIFRASSNSIGITSPGMYILTVTTSKRVTTKKIIVK